MLGVATLAFGLHLGPAAAPTRRQLITGAGLAAASTALPAGALEFVNPLDPRVAGGPRGLFPQSDIPMPQGGTNTGVLLIREAFDGNTPSEGLLNWLDAHLTADFEASFADGKVLLNKEVRRLRFSHHRDVCHCTVCKLPRQYL